MLNWSNIHWLCLITYAYCEGNVSQYLRDKPLVLKNAHWA